MVLRYIAGPVVGGVIGYCTNFLAVKMLFLPRHEVRVFGHRLPFTPGAIPKGKARLARAVGDIISKMLLTNEDISKKIAGDEVCELISERVSAVLENSVRETALHIAGSEAQYETAREKAVDALSEKILAAVIAADFSSIIEQEGVESVKEKVAGTMLQMFVNEDVIRSFVSPLAEKIKALIAEHGHDYIRREIENAVQSSENRSMFALLSAAGFEKEKVNAAVFELCKKAMPSLAASLTEKLDIARLIEDKMNAMDVMELENLVLSVMKKELDTIVNLGALIGALLGTINVFF